MAIYLKIRIIYVALVDMGTMADVIVFKSVRFQMSTLIRYVCVSICIHFQQRFQIDAFSVNTLSVFERISVDGRPKRINLYAFSNENGLMWTGPYYDFFVLDVLCDQVNLCTPQSTRLVF